ncbi:MAG: hypothetical protein ACMXYG_07110 [Candidatus Woesearchaeota archaeon]
MVKVFFDKKSMATILPIIAVMIIAFTLIAVNVGQRIFRGSQIVVKGTELPGVNLDEENLYSLIKDYVDKGFLNDAIDLSAEFIERFPKSDRIHEVYYFKFYSYSVLSRYEEGMTLINSYKHKYIDDYSSFAPLREGPKKFYLFIDYYFDNDIDNAISSLNDLFNYFDVCQHYLFSPLEWPLVNTDQVPKLNYFSFSWYWYTKLLNSISLCDYNLYKKYLTCNYNIRTNNIMFDPLIYSYCPGTVQYILLGFINQDLINCENGIMRRNIDSCLTHYNSIKSTKEFYNFKLEDYLNLVLELHSYKDFIYGFVNYDILDENMQNIVYFYSDEFVTDNTMAKFIAVYLKGLYHLRKAQVLIDESCPNPTTSILSQDELLDLLNLGISDEDVLDDNSYYQRIYDLSKDECWNSEISYHYELGYNSFSRANNLLDQDITMVAITSSIPDFNVVDFHEDIVFDDKFLLDDDIKDFYRGSIYHYLLMSSFLYELTNSDTFSFSQTKDLIKTEFPVQRYSQGIPLHHDDHLNNIYFSSSFLKSYYARDSIHIKSFDEYGPDLDYLKRSISEFILKLEAGEQS